MRSYRSPLLTTVLLATLAAWAQQTDPGAPPGAGTGGRAPFGEREQTTVSAQMQEQMADRRNSERQKQLVADTEKLYQLASELRAEVARSNKEQLSVPVVKRSEEIEKLARAVKERMRGY